MTIKTIFGAIALALTAAAPLAAAPVNLEFEFGSLTGTFFGLDNADGVSAATGVEVTGTLDTYSATTGIGVQANSFSFSGGTLVGVDFLQFFIGTAPGQTGQSSLDILSIAGGGD